MGPHRGSCNVFRSLPARSRCCGLCCARAPVRPLWGHPGRPIPLCDRVQPPPHQRSLEVSARGLIVTLTSVVGGAHFDSPEGDFIIYRLLVAQPWPERLVDPGMRTVQLLGRVFDLPGMYHRFERPIADAWCRWSLYWLWSLSRVWREANVARGGAV